MLQTNPSLWDYFSGFLIFCQESVCLTARQRNRDSPSCVINAFFLGLPAAIYTLIIHPLSMVLASNLGLGISMSGIKTTLFSHNYWRNLRGVRGPVWYLATLLSFDTLATLCIPYRRSKVIQYSQKLVSSRIGIPLLWLSSTGLTFFLRIFWPVGTTLPLITVQPAYLPQYILAYKLGFLSSITGVPNLLTPLNKNGALKDNSKSSESNIQAQDSRDTALFDQSPAIPIALSYFSLPLIFYRKILSRPNTRSWVQLDPLSFISGGLTLPAFLYVIWNEMSFALIGPRLLVHFSRFYNYCVKNTSLFHSHYSYAAFLVHTPIIILMGVGADRLLALIAEDRGFNNRFGRMLMPVIMTATVGTANVLGSFAVGKFLVDYMPGVGQII